MKTENHKPWPSGEPPDPSLCGEKARASILAAYGLDALEDDPELSEITDYAAELCGTPVALVTLVEEERQRFLVRAGLEERETPRPTSFCAHAMLQPKPMIVPDATLDERFGTNPLVTGQPYIRFYAGAPLISQEGAPLGSLCVIDTRPRPEGLTDVQRKGLIVLAGSVMRRLRHRREYLQQNKVIRQSELQLRRLIDSLPDIAWSAAPGPVFNYYNARWKERTGGDEPETIEGWREFVHPDDFDKFSDAFSLALKTASDFEFDWRLKAADGTYSWILFRAMPSTSDAETANWFGTLTDIDAAHRRSEERAILNQELSHRIKNIFSVVGSLARLKSREHSEVQPFIGELTGVLETLGRSHGYVTDTHRGYDETLQGLIRTLLAPYTNPDASNIIIEGEDNAVSHRAATPLALVFHELATNAAKYGALSVAEGTVSIVTEFDDEVATILWTERGGPAPSDTGKSGFGTQLIQRTASDQLGGSLDRDYGLDGLVAKLVISLSAL